MEENGENWPAEFKDLLRAIEKEQVPDKLLQLAFELQTALNAHRATEVTSLQPDKLPTTSGKRFR